MSAAQFFHVLLLGGLFTSVLALGTRTTREEVSYLWRRPSLMTRSLLTIYVVMPLVTLVLMRVLPVPIHTQIALVLLAISPGLPVAPKNMLKLGGYPPYVHSLLVSTSLIAIITVPVSLALLGAAFPEEAAIRPLQLLKVLGATFLVPLALGLLLRRRAPAVAERAAGPAGKIGAVALSAWFLILLVLNFRDVLDLGAWSLSAIALWTFVGLAVGHLLGGPDPANRSSLALATALRHIGVAAVIGKTCFEAAKPLNLILVYIAAYTFVPIPYSIWWKKRAAAKSLEVQAHGAN
jgi:BASS family bile acid:Na+ symporter